MLSLSFARTSRGSSMLLRSSVAGNKRLMNGLYSSARPIVQGQKYFSKNSTIFVRRNVAKGDHLAAKPVNTQKPRTTRWQQIAWFVKVTRIPALIAAIYTLGYQKGVVDTVRNPRKIQQGTFEQICMEMGCHSGEDIDIVWENSPPPSLSRLGWLRLTNYDGEKKPGEIKDPRAARVASVGREIIRAARTYISEELKKAVNKKAEELKSDDKNKQMSDTEMIKAIIEDESVEQWIHAKERIEGYTEDGIKNWQYILISTPIPNAFVSEMLPQRVFVTTALFDEFVKNDNELAMIMGHELSHLVMGHSSHGNLVEFMFRGLEITLLMLDPTEGLASLTIASFLASVRDALLASNSREHEREADELGCKLAALACFDTEKGSYVFKRMHDFDVSKGGGGGNDIMSSHPASIERYEFVRDLSKTVNSENFSHCGMLQKRLRGRALTLIGRPKT